MGNHDVHKIRSLLLQRVLVEVKNAGLEVSETVVDAAGKELDKRLSHLKKGQAFSEKEVRIIAKIVGRPRSPPKALAPVVAHQHEPPRAPTSTETCTVEQASIVSLRNNTTKRQRQILADDEWAKAAAADKMNAVNARISEKDKKIKATMEQKRQLDEQKEEMQRRRDEESRLRKQMKQEVDEQIVNSRIASRKEKEDAHIKAMKEKRYREDRQASIDVERERLRRHDLEDQVKQCEVQQNESRRRREEESRHRVEQKEEWKKVLLGNEGKLKERERDKERERETDRMFQRKYAENDTKVERERSEAMNRKVVRQQYFQSLADGVAAMFLSKEQDFTSKVDAEYEQQLLRQVIDENNRKIRHKACLQDCLSSQKKQIEERKRLADQVKLEERNFANTLREQSQQAVENEAARRHAARSEAQKMREFLNSQLQMAHFKETRPLETSIAKPKGESSPQRFSASPVR